MKSDIFQLMQADDIQAALITGSAMHNPALGYFTGPVHLTRGDLILTAGGDALLFHGVMERDEAAHAGLPLRSYTAYDMPKLRAEAGGDENRALALRYKQMFADAGVTGGRVVLYGKTELSSGFPVLRLLEEVMPVFQFVSETGNNILMQAMATKSPEEVARIRAVGGVTTAVIAEVADFLTGHRAKDGVLVRPDGQPLTIGDVKRKINLWLAERGVDNPHGTIFAIGRDAGVPHSSGTPADVLTLGKTIVFDIYPCEAGGGYHYDMTRTWCLGYATDEAYDLYGAVRRAYEAVKEGLRSGAPCSDFQELVCDMFQAEGHPTIRENPAAESGYIHGLGHGVGMNIHEAPWMRNKQHATATDVLVPGVVTTVEPGLYYPERGLGCRLEDTFYIRPDGEAEILAPYPLDLVLPVK